MNNKICVEFENTELHKIKGSLKEALISCSVKKEIIDPTLYPKINRETDEMGIVFEKLMNCMDYIREIDTSSSDDKEVWEPYQISHLFMISPDLPAVKEPDKRYVSDNALFGIYFEIVPEAISETLIESIRTPDKNEINEIQIYWVPGLLAMDELARYESYIRIMISGELSIEIRPGKNIKNFKTKFDNDFDTAIFKRIRDIVKAIKEEKV